MLSDDILNAARHLKASRDGLGELHLPASAASALTDFLLAAADQVAAVERHGRPIAEEHPGSQSEAGDQAEPLSGFEIDPVSGSGAGHEDTGKVVELFGVPRVRGTPPEGGAA